MHVIKTLQKNPEKGTVATCKDSLLGVIGSIGTEAGEKQLTEPTSSENLRPMYVCMHEVIIKEK